MQSKNHSSAGNKTRFAQFTHPCFGACRSDSRRVAVRWRCGIPRPLRHHLLRRLGLIPHPEPAANGAGSAPLTIHHSELLSWLAQVDGKPISNRVLNRLAEAPEIAWSAVSYHTIHDSQTLLENVFCVDPTRLYLQGDQRRSMARRAQVALGTPTDAPQVTQLAGVTVLRISAASLANGRGAAFLAASLAEEASRDKVTIRLENIPLVDH